MALINWLLKPKMHANTYLFYVLFLMKIRYKFLYFFEKLSRMHENKISFNCFLFKKNLFAIFQKKIEYFNTGFASLQCKNTNQY